MKTNMKTDEEQFNCINCGRNTKSLFKKYSATVLKLTECDGCNQVADKYVEYDIVIILLDLVLLQKNAYRHIIFNVKFKNFWKLFVILLLVESYSEWIRTTSSVYHQVEKEPFLNDIDVEIADFQFYRICFHLASKNCCFLLVLYLLTFFYSNLVKRSEDISFQAIWKTVTISSFGLFLLLPTLIWDIRLQESHLNMVNLYTIMCQLLAYTALFNCPKLWSIIAVFTSYYCKFAAYDIFVDVYNSAAVYSEKINIF